MADIKVNRVTNAAVYMDGNSLLGRAESIELPKVSFSMGENKPLGLIGSFETADEVEAMTAKIKWQSLFADVLSKINPLRAVQLQIRASVAEHGPQGRTGEVGFMSMMTGTFREFPSMTFKGGDAVMPESELAVSYYMAEMNGTQLIEFDALANILKINGTDVLAERRANLGL